MKCTFNRRSSFLLFAISVVFIFLFFLVVPVSAVYAQQCGDGACGVAEDSFSCPQDCAVCGDNVCQQEVQETCVTCAQDCGRCSSVNANGVTIEGDLRKWQKITLSFVGPESTESSWDPNPFLYYRMQVVFRGPNGQIYDVPGFFAGDGQGGSAGNVWRAHFTPDEAGEWVYQASLRQGNNVAIDLDPDAGVSVSFDGAVGGFIIGDAPANATGFNKKGRLVYDDGFYLKTLGDQKSWIKGGTDSPENFLAYKWFDRTTPNPNKAALFHDYDKHIQHWNPGDPNSDKPLGNCKEEGTYYQTVNGEVVIEAENYTNLGGTLGGNWSKKKERRGYKGEGYMMSTSDDPSTLLFDKRISRIDYEIDFKEAGTYYVHLRTVADNHTQNGFFAAIDNTEVHYGGINPENDKEAYFVYVGKAKNWTWRTDGGGAETRGLPVSFKIETPGIRVFSIYRRDKESKLDRIWITKHESSSQLVRTLDLTDRSDFIIEKDCSADYKGIIGSLNYLASKKVNSIYVLLMNIGGDGQEVWPYLRIINREGDKYGNSGNDNKHFDLSKLRQWDMVFQHAQKKGINIQMVLSEGEKQNKNELDGKKLGLERKLYYREMVARFGYLNALQWNLCEEYNINGSEIPEDEIRKWAAYVRDVDPYGHPITVHNGGKHGWKHFFGEPNIDLTSYQFGGNLNGLDYSNTVEDLRRSALAAGKKIVISIDETTAVANVDSEEAFMVNKPLPGGGSWDRYYGGQKWARKNIIYPIYFSGGVVEVITDDALRTDDFAPYAALWDYMYYARKFLENNVPFWEMKPADDLLMGESETYGGGQVFVKKGVAYAIYLPDATQSGALDLRSDASVYKRKWYNPRTGKFEGTTKQISGGRMRDLGAPPRDAHEDWVVLLANTNTPPEEPPVCTESWSCTEYSDW
ncbi:DUF5060 domain-containing protein, partial [Candidatus Omnitrophota bacterium]